MDDNQITDIAPLSNLAKLRYIYIYDNRITDITPLADATYLWVLDLEKTLLI